MIFTTAIAIALMFFVLGHSTLLYFLIEDNKGMTVAVARIAFPMPTKGKFVGLLCLLLAAAFFMLGIAMYPTMAHDPRPIPFVLMLLASMPIAVYAGYIISRIRKSVSAPGKLEFVTTHASPTAILLIIAIPVVINLLYQFFWLLSDSPRIT
ncbi:MAG: hypothetical protein V4633_13770 [Pseudomonadota bacterium]